MTTRLADDFLRAYLDLGGHEWLRKVGEESPGIFLYAMCRLADRADAAQDETARMTDEQLAAAIRAVEEQIVAAGIDRVLPQGDTIYRECDT